MRSTCPSCHAGYDIPDALVAGGRTVRCAHCGATWAVAPAPAEPEPDVAEHAAPAPQPPAPPPAPPPAMSRLRFEPAPEPGGSRAAVIGWVATVVVLGLAGAAAVTWRDAVMHAWPPSARVYQALGLATAANAGSAASR